jgi:hypothetical protein
LRLNLAVVKRLAPTSGYIQQVRRRDHLMLRARVAASPFVFVAWTVKVEVPTVVGVPDISPWQDHHALY